MRSRKNNRLAIKKQLQPLDRETAHVQPLGREESPSSCPGVIGLGVVELAASGPATGAPRPPRERRPWLHQVSASLLLPRSLCQTGQRALVQPCSNERRQEEGERTARWHRRRGTT